MNNQEKLKMRGGGETFKDDFEELLAKDNLSNEETVDQFAKIIESKLESKREEIEQKKQDFESALGEAKKLIADAQEKLRTDSDSEIQKIEDEGEKRSKKYEEDKEVREQKLGDVKVLHETILKLEKIANIHTEWSLNGSFVQKLISEHYIRPWKEKLEARCNDLKKRMTKSGENNKFY
ncbi:MAG: hypothetical protein ABIC82_05865 [bacterium]